MTYYFFDYGGLLAGDRRSVINECKKIVQHAQDHPSRFYVLASLFTEFAVKDALREMARADEKPPNLLYVWDDLSLYLKAGV